MSEEIKEIVDKLSNRKQETLIQGLRECQLKDIEHPFITKEEYIDKLLDYITNLQQKVEEKDKEIDRLNKLLDETRLSELHKEYIINELEKVFIECDYQHLQRKLKALKEDNKDV